MKGLKLSTEHFQRREQWGTSTTEKSSPAWDAVVQAVLQQQETVATSDEVTKPPSAEHQWVMRERQLRASGNGERFRSYSAIARVRNALTNLYANVDIVTTT